MTLTDFARNLRQQATDAERLLWSRLRGRRLMGYKFRRQMPAGGYIVDFVCLESRLVVELDGGQHLIQQPRDQARTCALSALGFRVVRFWNDQVLQELEAVLEVVLEELGNTPHPSPPSGGEGAKDRVAGPCGANRRHGLPLLPPGEKAGMRGRSGRRSRPLRNGLAETPDPT